jgi:2-oxoglutarate dehydrogenase E2 component (dihydrolipoamide succinyltransferase)
MPIELKVPEIGESITEVEIGDWLKKPGDSVKKDESLVMLESDKATVEFPSPESGTLGQILKKQGEMAKIGEVIAHLETGETASAKKPEETKAPETKPSPAPPKQESKPQPDESQSEKIETTTQPRFTEVKTDQDRPRSERLRETTAAEHRAPARPEPQKAPSKQAEPVLGAPKPDSTIERQTEVVPMNKLRRTVAERLVEAQHNAALLTTFNEIDMSSVMALRKEHGEAFLKKYNVKLGFLSFFVKAAIDALKQFPAINAEIRGTDIVYHNYFDIGVAIGGGKGLVVPVLRNAERMSFAEIEMAIGDFGQRAKDNKLKPDELQGGTFTISNGGVYGSLLSTPIVNPPQSGVLGLHGIQERPVARDGQVVIRPMMYVALTYDHRLVDGREAVTFLKRVKETIENPARMLIEV